MFRFRGFKVYKDSISFAKDCEKVLSDPKLHKNPQLINQARAAYLSIVLNIAEGSGCDSDKEFRRFLEISLRSAHEVVAAFDLALELGLINAKIISEIEAKAEILCKQLNGFRRSLAK